MKLYLVTYNSDAVVDRASFHKFITGLYPAYFTDWWHYLDNVYIIATNLDVNKLYNLVYPVIPNQKLLIIEIEPSNNQGWLHPDAWKWINKYRAQ